MTQLESLDADTAEFEALFAQLQSSVVAHAQSEELEEFEPLADKLDRDSLERMRQLAIFAERFAPTRPHAGVESAGANILAGPFAAMLDRVRDAISGKS